MSAISSNSNNPAKIREYYAKREEDLHDKFKTEVENLNKSHSDQLGSIKDQATGQIDENKARFQSKLTEQDKKHQQEIESLKAIYQKKLEDQARKLSES